ncbi:hypothetical protein PVAND_000128 [Polypedilum vanderplanki]|uniref:Clip domain-containing protein n=1 Tax=Polypedilum vanderplanki TaxID=319348 RepID=A0A9J6BJ43_POLVA|nr:hypothetical protein PVAND_000128 [Polypedilum vanderplanki]
MRKLIKFIILFTFFHNLCQSRHTKQNLQIGDECKIPNQNKTRGICIKRRDCVEYEELFNVTDLGVERLSFILYLDCGFDYESFKSLVCCPKPGNSYKKPDLDVDPENLRVREENIEAITTETVDLENRFGEETTTNKNKKKCGVNFSFEDRIVGGELCELDKYLINESN